MAGAFLWIEKDAKSSAALERLSREWRKRPNAIFGERRIWVYDAGEYYHVVLKVKLTVPRVAFAVGVAGFVAPLVITLGWSWWSLIGFSMVCFDMFARSRFALVFGLLARLGTRGFKGKWKLKGLHDALIYLREGAAYGAS